MTPTFEQLRNELAKLNWGGINSLAARVDAVLDSGRVNADDTIFLEKAAPEGDWNNLAIDSIRSILAFSDDKPVIKWFARRGIEA